jgi:hypothetical protein
VGVGVGGSVHLGERAGAQEGALGKEVDGHAKRDIKTRLGKRDRGCARGKEPSRHVKRNNSTRQKSHQHMSKETSRHVKRDINTCQRDIKTCQKTHEDMSKETSKETKAAARQRAQAGNLLEGSKT